jgi:AcrR family transcriptional regulator
MDMTGESAGKHQKRTRMKGDERREAMLHHAKSVFAQYGYADASTGELARASEVTEPMLYKHFGSKKGLFMAVLREFSTQFLAELQERIERRSEQDIADALEHIIDDYRAAMKSDAEVQRLLFLAVTESGDADVARCVGNHNRKIYGFIRQLVERAREQGFLDPTVNLDAAAWGYMSMILANQYALMLNLSREVAQVQPAMSQIWLRGLRA